MPITLQSPALATLSSLLAAMLEADTLPHAVLFEGATAAQRREAALALARALMCARKASEEEDETSMFGGMSLFGEPEDPAPEATAASQVLPCEGCSHCRKSAEGIHPDLQILEGGAGARSFHIDAIRGVRRDACVLPNEADVKVYVLLEAQSMTPEAQNALLKLLEEPPDYVCLILTVPARRMLLQTVLSRSLVLSLGEAAEEPLDAERETQITQRASIIAQALYKPRTPYAPLEATAPLEGDRDLLRDVLPALRKQLHTLLVKEPAAASRLLGLIEGVRGLEAALDRSANLNLLITQLAAL